MEALRIKHRRVRGHRVWPLHSRRGAGKGHPTLHELLQSVELGGTLARNPTRAADFGRRRLYLTTAGPNQQEDALTTHLAARGEVQLAKAVVNAAMRLPHQRKR